MKFIIIQDTLINVKDILIIEPLSTNLIKLEFRNLLKDRSSKEFKFTTLLERNKKFKEIKDLLL